MIKFKGFRVFSDIRKDDQWGRLSETSIYVEELLFMTKYAPSVCQVLDIKHTRIDEFLQDMAETMFCELPEKEPWTINQYLSKTKVGCAQLGRDVFLSSKYNVKTCQLLLQC